MTFWFSRTNDPNRALGVLGPLEWNVLEALWKREAPASVRDLTPEFSDIAYTTLMTTLDRLQSARAGDAVRAALRNGGSLAPLASYLMDAVGNRDRELLDELEALVAQRRTESRKKP
jgi:hypothetical protein